MTISATALHHYRGLNSSLPGATELVVAFGGIPAKNVHVTPGGVTRHATPQHLARLAESGAEVVLVSPMRSDLPDNVPSTWLPIRPGTDAALMLGVAHTLVVEGLQDEQFLATHCAGFETFRDHLLVEQRTAEWAGRVCDLDSDKIRELAFRMAEHRTFITVTWSLQRAQHGEQPVHAGLALAAMLGQIGLPGAGFGHGYGSMGEVGENGTDVRLPHLPQGTNAVADFIPCARIADLLLHPGAAFEYDGSSYVYPDIRYVHWAGGNPFHHHQDLGRLRRAFARPDTVVVNEPYWTATARHADVVFPITTSLEREDLGSGRRDSHLIGMHQILDPVGEARDDYAVFSGLAERLGCVKEFTEGRTPREWLIHLYEDWRSQQTQNYPDFTEFWQAGELPLPVNSQPLTLFQDFRNDPVANALDTPSGRIEITSSEIAAMAIPGYPGHPVWCEPDEWLGSPNVGEGLLMIANQPGTRLHSQHDAGATSVAAKVAGREALQMHPDTAKQRGIQEGDVVRVCSRRGAMLAGVRLTDHIRADVIRVPTGAWFDPLDTDQGLLCVHGNPNVLTADVPASALSQGCAGQHALVTVSRYDDIPPPVTVHRPPDLLSQGSVEMAATHSGLRRLKKDRS